MTFVYANSCCRGCYEIPELCVLPPFIFLSISDISPTDVLLRRTVDSSYHLSSLEYFTFDEEEIDRLATFRFIIHMLLNSTRNIVAVVDSIVKETYADDLRYTLRRFAFRIKIVRKMRANFYSDRQTGGGSHYLCN